MNYTDLPASVQKTLPFLIVPKASSKEKNAGLENSEKNIGNSLNHGTSLEKNSHDTVKPVKLMEHLITLGTQEHDLIIDPFCGTGTTCIAALKLNRSCIGIEKCEESYEIAKRRLLHALLQISKRSKL